MYLAGLSHMVKVVVVDRRQHERDGSLYSRREFSYGIKCRDFICAVFSQSCSLITYNAYNNGMSSFELSDKDANA